jgi:hypothetical protein
LLKSNNSWVLDTFFGIQLQKPGKAEEFIRPSLDYANTSTTLSDCFGSNAERDKLVLKEYMNYTGIQVVGYQVNQVLPQTGVIATRSVGEHVLGTQEPILKLSLDPSDPRYNSHAILINDPSLDSEPQCRSTADLEEDYLSCIQHRHTMEDGSTLKTYWRAPTTYYTGYEDIRKVGQMVDYHGNTTIEHVFDGVSLTLDGAANDLPGSIQYGYSAGMVFPPNQKVAFHYSLSICDSVF